MAIWPFGKKRKEKRVDRRLTTEESRAEVSVESLNKRRAYTVEDSRPISGQEIQDSQVSHPLHSGLAKEPKVDAGGHPQALLETDPQMTANAVSSSTALTGSEKDTRPEIDVGTRGDAPSYYFLNPMSTASLASENQRGGWQRPPTLRNKRTFNDSGIIRRISSKKKKRDDEREQKIKSMSAPVPNPRRPLTHSGGPIRRDRAKGYSQSDRDLVRPNMSTSHIRRQERPRSQGPPTDSDTLPPTFAPLMEQPAYKIRALDILSPRPTLRCWDSAQQLRGGSPQVPSRSNSRREKQRQPPTIPEELGNDKRRVNELADHLDSSGLRELMERDQRRRERRRKAEELRMQRKLERQAEKQRREEEERKREVNVDADDANVNPFEDQTAVDDVGISTSSAGYDPGGPLRDPRKDDGNSSPHSWLHDPSVERLHEGQNPEISRRNSESHLEDPTPIDDQEEPVIRTAKAVRLSSASMSPPSSPKQEVRPISNISQITDPFREPTASTSEPTEPDLPGSISSSKGGQGGASTWMSFFRRSGAKNKHDSFDRGRQTPSEFSNTSRDSLSRQPLPASVQSSFQRRSGTPVRTTSKFREELPELPISPPDSRLQSPIPVSIRDAAAVATRTDSTSTNTFNVAADAAAAHEIETDIVPKPKEGMPVHRQHSVDAPSIEGKAPTVISQSMASIDSEGSWLSGKPAKRSSQNPIFNIRNSASSLHRRFLDLSDSGEEHGVTEDEYFNRLTPGLEVEERSGHVRKPSSAAIASSESEGELEEGASDEQRKWHGGVARHPTVVHHAPRAKSREGLLNEYQEQGSPDGGLGESPGSDVRSFDYAVEDITKTSNAIANVDQGRRQHLRHISAGSAKLLDLGHRDSNENRRSVGSTKGSAKAGV